MKGLFERFYNGHKKTLSSVLYGLEENYKYYSARLIISIILLDEKYLNKLTISPQVIIKNNDNLFAFH